MIVFGRYKVPKEYFRETRSYREGMPSFIYDSLMFVIVEIHTYLIWDGLNVILAMCDSILDLTVFSLNFNLFTLNNSIAMGLGVYIRTFLNYSIGKKSVSTFWRVDRYSYFQMLILALLLFLMNFGFYQYSPRAKRWR